MTTAAAETPHWLTGKKIAFRFCLLFFVLYIVLNSNPLYHKAFDLYIPVFHRLIPWLAKNVLHLSKPVTTFTNISRDTTYDYLMLLLITALSLAGTIIWSVTGRKTNNYNKLFYWLTVVLRYYLAITIISYARIKLLNIQFPLPPFYKLAEPLGSLSPMGLAWAFMSYSTGYNYFIGFAELACGVLLLFRKTTTLGAVLGLVIMGNVMAFNYCFDVPLKLFVTVLFLMFVFLMAKDSKRLIDFFVRNKEAQPSNTTPHRFKARWKNIALITAKYVLLASVAVRIIYSGIRTGVNYNENMKRPPLYGIYNVVTFIKNRDTLKPLKTDTTRWDKLMISYDGTAQIQLTNDSIAYYRFKPDVKSHTITASTYTDTAGKFRLTYTQQKPDILLLKGMWKKDSVCITLHQRNPKDFPLLKRGFHWVSEAPYAR